MRVEFFFDLNAEDALTDEDLVTWASTMDDNLVKVKGYRGWRLVESPAESPADPADAYEVTNLRAGLLTLRALGLDTGDWMGQILNRLPPSPVAPNVLPEVQVANARRRLLGDWG